jgi:hypothetical protein
MILSDIETRQSALVQRIAEQLALDNDVPMMAVGWQAVREEIEFSVVWLLTGQVSLQAAIPPTLAPMVAAWRMLDREARAERARCSVRGAPAIA